MTNLQALSVALLVLPLAPACSPDCSSLADVYTGSEVLPNEKVTAEELLAKSEFSITQVRPWIPDPSEFKGSVDPVPPLDLEGSAALDPVTPLSDELSDSYFPVLNGCDASGSPNAPILVTIRTSDGVLDEEVTGTVSSSDGEPFVFADITEPEGSIKSYFDGIEEPLIPHLLVAIRRRAPEVRLQIERRRRGGASYEYVTLL